MESKTNLRVYNSLFFKIYAYYAIILTVFAVLLGIIFLELYSNNSMETYRDRSQEQAETIAERMSEFIVMEDYEQVPSYLETLEVMFYPSDIYIISNSKSETPMNRDLENANLNDIEFTKKFEKILMAAFQGESDYIISFSPVYDEVMLAIGVPIFDGDMNAVGAVLLYSPIENQKKMINSSKSLIFSSAATALVVAFVIALIFAGNISRPISKMRRAALKLAEGKYDVKVSLKRKDEIGDLAGSIDILSDKLLENEIERKNIEQMRMDFFANVSHELRTPITVVRAYSEMLIDGVVTDDEKKQQYYYRMVSECKSMERLVGDLLLLSKMQNPDFEIEKEPVNIVQVFEDIIRGVQAITVSKQLHIIFLHEKEEYFVLGDYDRLRQMFLVIVDNAVKFSKEESNIEINVCTPGKLSVSIKDEGIGIAPEELSYIFDKFYKSKLKQNEKGSGLGLAIARQIAWKHGGNIQVKSEVNVGTEFIFTFKLLNEDNN